MSENKNTSKPKWNNKLASHFVRNINTENIIKINNEICQMSGNVDQIPIDDLSSKLANIFLSSSNITFPETKRIYFTLTAKDINHGLGSSVNRQVNTIIKYVRDIANIQLRRIYYAHKNYVINIRK
jgi:hypothetical protein